MRKGNSVGGAPWSVLCRFVLEVCCSVTGCVPAASADSPVMRESKMSDRDKEDGRTMAKGPCLYGKGAICHGTAAYWPRLRRLLESWCAARPAGFIGQGRNRGVGGLRQAVIGRIRACESRPCPFGAGVVAGLGRAAARCGSAGTPVGGPRQTAVI